MKMRGDVESGHEIEALARCDLSAIRASRRSDIHIYITKVGNIHEKNLLLKTATQVLFWGLYPPIEPQREQNTRGVAGTTKAVSRRRGLGRQF